MSWLIESMRTDEVAEAICRQYGKIGVDIFSVFESWIHLDQMTQDRNDIGCVCQSFLDKLNEEHKIALTEKEIYSLVEESLAHNDVVGSSEYITKELFILAHKYLLELAGKEK